MIPLGRLAEIRHVRQEDPKGCLLATIAMLTGGSYAQIRDWLGDPKGGHTYHLWQDVLARAGLAYQFIYRYDQLTRKEHEPWPPALWAPAHIAAVDAGAGLGSHSVVVLLDGTVLDPLESRPSRWSDYSGIGYLAGIFDVSAGPSFGEHQ